MTTTLHHLGFTITRVKPEDGCKPYWAMARPDGSSMGFLCWATYSTFAVTAMADELIARDAPTVSP